MTAASPPVPRAPGLSRAMTVGAVLALALFAFSFMFFVRSADAMVLIFGTMAAVMAFAIPVVIAVVARVLEAPRAAPAVAVRCRECGALNPEAARFCNHCGRPL